MSNIKLLMVTFLILLFGLGFGVACSSGNTPSPNIKPTESDVRNFADSMVENMLQAMNTADYAQYTVTLTMILRTICRQPHLRG
jgi:hypothetical protein